MSRRENRDYLYLVWKNPNTRRNYTIGELSKNGKYEFSYGHEIEEAIKSGFELLIAFGDRNKTYENDMLFPSFSSRLPDRKRRDIARILKKYKLDEYDEYELLKKSGARLPIDNIEFIDPIFEDDKEDIKRDFYIAGCKYYLGCKAEKCFEAKDVKVGQFLKLIPEPENQYDENAIKIMDSEGEKIGYIPRFFSKEVSSLIRKGLHCECEVLEYNKEKECQECIKVKLTIYSGTKEAV